MSTVFRRVKPVSKPHSTIPLLYAGDRLPQPEFHRRYEAYPDDTKFELVGGIVFMSSPTGFGHASHDLLISTAFGLYEAATDGVIGGQNATAILGLTSEPQPDLVLLIEGTCGGQARIERRGEVEYIVGAPELVLEVSHSTVSLDLHDKRQDYQLGGVQEYVVYCIAERQLRWFDLKADESELSLPADGILRSLAFPGLWLDSQALIARDKKGFVATAQAGLESVEHKRFIAHLANKRTQLRGKTPRTAKKKTSPRRKRDSK